MNLQCSGVVAPYDPPQARVYSSIVGQEPAAGVVVTEGQAVVVHLYQPQLRVLIDWARTLESDPSRIEATHTLRGPEEGPPGDNPGRWVDTGSRIQLFARQVPGAVPVFCWNLTSEGGTLRHFCGTQVPPQYNNPTSWTVGYGGTAIGWAYDDDLGVGAVGRFPCGLVKVNASTGRQLPIGSYYNASPVCGLMPDSGPPDRYEPWDAFWTPA
ncbi:MAG TPA: hypothetical protein VK507_19025 [Iamia sp.]|nr:hypothetical protein [Iamia sp.]